jgi:D-glycero-D-manno-heptose 1,7-bisphosphate phosphatase
MTDAPGGRAAVFLDRDGTLNEDRGYVGFRRDFVWLPGAVEAVQRLNEAGFALVVVTNQAGVARGFYTEDDVRRLHDEVQADLAAAGARVDAFYYAPHHLKGVVPAYVALHPDRKPGTGMFDRAIRDLGLDPARSFMVGDKESDITPARTLGLTTVLVRTGFGRAHEPTTAADHVVDDLPAAADLILKLSAISS